MTITDEGTACGWVCPSCNKVIPSGESHTCVYFTETTDDSEFSWDEFKRKLNEAQRHLNDVVESTDRLLGL